MPIDQDFYEKIRTIFNNNDDFQTPRQFMQERIKTLWEGATKKRIENDYEIRKLCTMCNKFEIEQNSLQSVNIKSYFKIWTLGYLSNKLKTFFFKWPVTA